jgi:hypothetical protein
MGTSLGCVVVSAYTVIATSKSLKRHKRITHESSSAASESPTSASQSSLPPSFYNQISEDIYQYTRYHRAISHLPTKDKHAVGAASVGEMVERRDVTCDEKQTAEGYAGWGELSWRSFGEWIFGKK